MHDNCYFHIYTLLKRRYTFFVQSVFYNTTGFCPVCDSIAAISESHLFKLTVPIAEELLMIPKEKSVVADAYIVQQEPSSRMLTC